MKALSVFSSGYLLEKCVVFQKLQHSFVRYAKTFLGGRRVTKIALGTRYLKDSPNSEKLNFITEYGSIVCKPRGSTNKSLKVQLHFCCLGLGVGFC